MIGIIDDITFLWLEKCLLQEHTIKIPGISVRILVPLFMLSYISFQIHKSKNSMLVHILKKKNSIHKLYSE